MRPDVRCGFLLFFAVSFMAFSVKDIRYGSYVFFTVSALSFALGQIKKNTEIYACLCAAEPLYCGGESSPAFSQKHAFTAGFGSKDLHADYALRACIFKNHGGQ